MHRVIFITIWRLVSSLIPRKTGFGRSPVQVIIYVVDKVAMGEVFLRVLGFSLLTLIPTVRHIKSFICYQSSQQLTVSLNDTWKISTNISSTSSPMFCSFSLAVHERLTNTLQVSPARVTIRRKIISCRWLNVCISLGETEVWIVYQKDANHYFLLCKLQ